METNVELERYELDPNAFVFGTGCQITSLSSSAATAVEDGADAKSLKANAVMTKGLAGLLNISNL